MDRLNYTQQIKKIIEKIKEADAILIGASNGFSICEGLHLFAGNQAFQELFPDFIEKYRFRNILDGCFFQYPTEEEKWTYWSRLIWHYSGNYKGSAVMDSVKTIIKDKPYFIVTSNGEGHFSLAGLESERIYEIEGNWFSMQCAHRCHDTLYPSMDMIKKMATAQKNGGITSEIVPKCPVCGENMQINLALDNSFIPDFEGPKRFQSFIKQYHGKSLLVLELGIGWRNQLIKPTLMNIVNQEPNATYVTVNKGEIYITDEIADKSFGLDGDMKEILTLLKEKMTNI